MSRPGSQIYTFVNLTNKPGASAGAAPSTFQEYYDQARGPLAAGRYVATTGSPAATSHVITDGSLTAPTAAIFSSAGPRVGVTMGTCFQNLDASGSKLQNKVGSFVPNPVQYGNSGISCGRI